MRVRLALGGALLALGVLGTVGTARAQVTSADDPDPSVDGTIRFEIDNASADDVIDVQVGAADGLETISLRETLVFTQNLAIDNSSDDTALVDLNAPADGNFLEIQDGVSVILRDLELAGAPLTTADDIDLQGATSLLTIDSERADQLVTVDIVGDGMFRKEGTRSLQLSGINDFTGGITVDDGDLIGELRSFGSGAITLEADDAAKVSRLVFDLGGTNTLTGSGPAIVDGTAGGGTASIVKRGSGTLDVSAATIASTLDFEVESGTLRVGATQLTNGHDFSISSGTTVELDEIAGPVTSGSVFTGSGTIDVEADDLTLSADPSGFTGTFDVNAGPGMAQNRLVLDIGAAPASALTFNAVADGTDVEFTLRDAVGVTYAGDVSGDGTFVKVGAGTTTITGAHTQVGGTRVLGGTLVASAGNLPGTLDVSSGATAIFDQSSDATFGSMLMGAGTIRKRDAGVLTLAASNPFSGVFQVEGGGLHFTSAGDLMGGSLQVGAGATLSADFDPAASLAANTIGLGGTLTFESDARVTVGISDVSEGDGEEPTANISNVFAATGAVIIEDGAVLAVDAAIGNYSSGDFWDVITGSSVVGTFTIEQDLVFFTLGQIIEGENTLRLRLTDSEARLGDEATTPNGVVIGDQLDDFLTAMFESDSMSEEERYQDAIRSLRIAEVPAVLESLSPDDLAASSQIQLANANRTWRGVSDRMAIRRSGGVGGKPAPATQRRSRPSVSARRGAPAEDPAAPRTGERTWQAWMEASGVLGELSSSDAKEFEYVSAGPIVGADRAVGDDARFGFALGGGSHTYETNSGNGEGEGGGIEGTLYGAWLGDPVEVIGGVRYAWTRIETERTLSVSAITDRVDGELEGSTFGAFLEVTRGFDLPKKIEIAPLASVAWTGVRWDAFDESGTSPLAVQVEEQSFDSILTSVGVRIAAERRMQDDVWVRPRVKALWNHEWGDVEREVEGTFVSAPTAGLAAFTVEGAEMPRDHAEVAIGWEVGFTANANLFLDWDGRFGEDLIENGISVGGRVVW